MADIFADGGLADGDNDGTSWENAYRTEATLQTGLDGLAAGDTLHITRTFTLTATLDLDQANGALGNRIKLLGYNYNGGEHEVDGTLAVIDANGAADYCILADSREYWDFHNVRFTNAVRDCVSGKTAAAKYFRFINCDFDNATLSGCGSSGGAGWNGTTWALCRFYSNNIGLATISITQLLLCSVYDNTSGGFSGITYGCAAYCAAWDNGGQNFNCGVFSAIVSCMSDDGATSALYANSQITTVLGCRLTGTGTGILGDGSAEVLDLYNFINTATKTNNITVDQQVRGSDTRIESGTEGYEDAANDLYNLKLGAAGYRTEIDIGGGNYARLARGLPTSIIPKIGEK